MKFNITLQGLVIETPFAVLFLFNRATRRRLKEHKQWKFVKGNQ